MSESAPKKIDPIRPTDDAARALGRELLADARFGAIGVREPGSGAPMVTRIAVGADRGTPVILVSTLSSHTTALRADPVCSLLVGEPGRKGDPLTYPRLTVQAVAEPAEKAALRDGWLATHPKAKLYIDFTDFIFFRLRIREAHLNGGFGKAYRLTPADLGQPAG